MRIGAGLPPPVSRRDRALAGERGSSWAGALKCWMCKREYTPERQRVRCECGQPLEQTYTLPSFANRLSWAEFAVQGAAGAWRYGRMLPVQDLKNVVSLGEGGTPLVELAGVGAALGIRLFVKDESRNPTGSFKARGASVGISRLRELGWTELAMPTTGSGGSAWAAVAARAGLAMRVGVVQGEGISEFAYLEPAVYGACVERLKSVGAKPFAEYKQRLPEGVLSAGAFEEPYRLEGEKTLFYEVVEQLGGRAPDVVVWPTGGGVGLVGIVKAYEELVALGLVDSGRAPTVVAAQHVSSSPIADALRDSADVALPGAPSGLAPGVWVAIPSDAEYILKRVRGTCETDGASVSDAELVAGIRIAATRDGVLLGPEGGLALAGVVSLCAHGRVPANATVVCVNTGTALRYPMVVQRALAGPDSPPQVSSMAVSKS